MHNQVGIPLSTLSFVEQHPIEDIGGQAKILGRGRGAKEEDDRLVTINGGAHQHRRVRGNGRTAVVGLVRHGRGGVVGGGEEMLGVVEACGLVVFQDR